MDNINLTGVSHNNNQTSSQNSGNGFIDSVRQNPEQQAVNQTPQHHNSKQYMNQYMNHSQNTKNNNKRSSGLIGKIGAFTLIFLLGIGVGGGSTYYLSNNVIPNWENNRIISKVQELTSTDSELEYVGDNYNPEIVELENLGDIRLENSIQAEVYKDAENGDYALIQDDNLVIYSKRSGQIVYQGQTPVALVEQLQNDLISSFEEQVTASGVLGDFDSEQFQYQIVEEPSALLQQDPDFYSGVVQGDIIALYEPEDMLFLFNPQTGELRNSGKINTTISPF